MDKPQEVPGDVGGQIGSSEPTNEMMRDMFAQYGFAAYWGQRLENTLVQTLTFLARVINHATPPADLSSLELTAQKKTLGWLLRELRSKVNPAEPVEEMLDKALDQRNFLTHHFFRERQEETASAEGLVRMVKELHEIGELLAQANQVMTVLAKILLKVIRKDAERLTADQNLG